MLELHLLQYEHLSSWRDSETGAPCDVQVNRTHGVICIGVSYDRMNCGTIYDTYFLKDNPDASDADIIKYAEGCIPR